MRRRSAKRGRTPVARSSDVSGASRRANLAFAAWWVGLGLLYLLAPLYTLPPKLFGFEDLALSVTILNVIFLLLIGAVWGLVYYLAFLYTGDSRAFWPISFGRRKLSTRPMTSRPQAAKIKAAPQRPVAAR